MPHKSETTLQTEFNKQNFKNEAEEAKWWFDNQDLVADAFEKAAANGTLGRGTSVRKAAVPTTTIRLEPADISKARVQAERKGLKYQTYLKMLIREALQREDAASLPISRCKSPPKIKVQNKIAAR